MQAANKNHPESRKCNCSQHKTRQNYGQKV